MADTTNSSNFEELVEWAYSTLPQKVRHLPDFPGIQVVDEPPAEVFAEMAAERKWRLELNYWACTAAHSGRNGHSSR